MEAEGASRAIGVTVACAGIGGQEAARGDVDELGIADL